MLFAFLLLFADAPTELESLVRKMANVYALVEANAADPVDANRGFYEGAVPGMLRQLDPHSVFFSPAQFDQLKEMQRSTSKGFGTVVSVLPGRVIVLQTLPGTPASRSGIEAGDEILAVNGIRLDWLTMDQLVDLLGESRQREARLDVRRIGSPRLLQFTMKPEALASPSVDRAFLLRDGIGFVRITSFEADTAKLAREAIEKLGGSSLKGLVLDLRNNPGGIMESALATAALFLEPGTRIVTVRGRAREGQEIDVPKGGSPYRFPLSVLINGKSASGSEIVAGGLQDHDRADIIGEASYGKGLVQSVYPLPQGCGMALTTAFYFTPSGRSIQRPLTGGQLEGRATWSSLSTQQEFRTGKGRAVKGGGGITPDHIAWPEGMTRLRMALDATGSFTAFATEFVRRTPKIDESFQVSDSTMDDYQLYMSERRIRPSVSEWSIDREWIRSRLLQEIFNLALGVEKGDEIEMRRDPQVNRALSALGQ
jgi:carboxyl-terminal processing protease